MAEDKGYWFTTENGVHVHVEPGESKEQALLRKFGDKNSKEKRYFEPEGGFKNEVRHVIYGKYNEDDSSFYTIDKNKSTVSYKGETGSYTDMLAKYGRTADEVLRSTGKSAAEKREIAHVKERINTQASLNYYDFDTGKTSKKIEGEKWFWDNYYYERGNKKVDTKEVDKPTYTQNVYNKQGSLVASHDSTGRQSGNISHSMQYYNPLPQGVGSKSERKEYRNDITKYSTRDFERHYKKGSNYKKK